MAENGEWLMRSLLFVPGHITRYMESALKCGADVIIPDLEDSVPGNANKKKALDNIISFAKNGKFDGLKVFPRVNSYLDDYEFRKLSNKNISGFIIPKVKVGKNICTSDYILTSIEMENGLCRNSLKIIPLIETAAAVMNVADIANASKRIVAIAFGSEDFLNDLGGENDPEGQSIFTARSLIAMAAKANGIQAIDTVHTDVFDFEGLHKHCIIGRNLGFDGMLALNPKELPLIHKYYSPSEELVEHAMEIIRLSDQAKKNGRGVAIIDGKFIGPPMVEAAKKVIYKNELLKAKNESTRNTWR